MAENTKIEWATHTANLWWGCVEVHEGCDNCYAKVLANRWGKEVWGNDVHRMAIKGVWKDLAKYQKLAKKANEIHSVFVGSMMDIFEKPMPIFGSVLNTDILRDRLFTRITDNEYPNIMFLLLTKRPSNINKYIPESWKNNPPKNVMFGTSPVNQITFNRMIDDLRQVNGKRFLSVEPQLELIRDINLNGISWLIQGGESGGNKRPFKLSWARIMRDKCEQQNVPYFFKQIDKIRHIPQDLQIRQFPKY